LGPGEQVGGKGDSNTEAIRALKRHIARRVYTLLRNGPEHAQADSPAHAA
jgi:ribosomal protein L29